jgi:phosphate starvation-inducible PhoH-like protein
LSRGLSEFLPLSEEAVRAIAGPGGRHAALIEDAFHVLMETPGGGVALNGEARARRWARAAVENLAARVADDLEVTPTDVRLAIDQARAGGPAPAAAVKRGAVGASSN